MADAICAKCNEYYKDPRMLPCLHNFCLQCLEKELRMQVSQDTLHCPNCKEMITLSENGTSDLPQDLHKAHEAEIARIFQKIENMQMNYVRFVDVMILVVGKQLHFAMKFLHFLQRAS